MLILSRQELIFHTGIFIGRATALKIFLAVAFLLCEILLKISHIFFNRRVNASGRVNKSRGKIETVRPFEPSSTVVRPCTTVEDEFCARTKHRYCMEPLPSLAVRSNSIDFSAGMLKKRPDAFTLIYHLHRYGKSSTIVPLKTHECRIM